MNAIGILWYFYLAVKWDDYIELYSQKCQLHKTFT